MSAPAKISLALGAKKSASTNGVKRSHAALREDEDDHHDEGAAQTVSHFDRSAGGAIDAAAKKPDQGPLIIASQKNRDWRDASKRRKVQRNGLPPENVQEMSDLAIQKAEAGKPAYGLVVSKKEGEEADAMVEDGDVPEASTKEQAPASNGEAPAVQKTDDELAMDALLGKSSTDTNLVLPAMSEEAAFEASYATAPPPSTLDDYARVPVEQFGAALLRGMGWKDGEGIGAKRGQKAEKTKMPERRPALLGIGAKEEAAVKEEMGAWGRNAGGRGKGKELKVYNPVLLRDKKTGELFTEEEVQKRKESDERAKYEEEFERKEREKDRSRREVEGERDGERSHRRDKDRRREKDSRHDKERSRRDESDEEYHRRKEKERRRRERDRDDSDYDREHRRRHERPREDRSRERHRDRRR